MGCCLAVYIIVMILLLYSKGISARDYRIQSAQANGFWQTVRRYTNPVPLKTIRPFLRRLPEMQLSDLILNQIVGNVWIFIPAGIFFPFYSGKLRRLRPFFRTVLLLILFIEISQVLTFLGSFDADDILLNLTGCLIGWILFKMIYGILHLFRPKKRASEE